MEEIQLTLPSSTPFSPMELLLNLAVCIVAAFILRYVYINKSISLSGKYHIGSIIPVLALITFLVIMVVKSSLALSLGLVGALSIVRFRTPIKEPEELIYLFLSIALGLGYGAGQTLVTTIIFLTIMIIIYVWLSRKAEIQGGEFNLMIDWSNDNISMADMTKAVTANTVSADLRKYNSNNGVFSLFLTVAFDNPNSIVDVERSVKETEPKSILSFSESRPLQ